jgi:hypothetical protein
MGEDKNSVSRVKGQRNAVQGCFGFPWQATAGHATQILMLLVTG